MNISTLDFSNGVHTLEADSLVFGVDQQFYLEEIENIVEDEQYLFEIRDFYSQDTRVVVPYEEAHEENTQTVDPKKVLLWILKKIREAICPECL